MKAFKLIPMILLAIFLAGCGSPQVMDGSDMVRSYAQISPEEAMRMMQEDDGHVIVDVRRQDEYDAGHIPGAILISNESIGCDSPEALPDYDQVILVYCRSGNRSKQAAEKLAAMGYTNIVEIGGIETWPGEIEEGEDMQNAFVKTDLIMDTHKDGEKDGVILSLESFAYPVMEMTLSNQSGRPFTYGSAFVLETNDNGEWKETEKSREMMWTMEAYELADGESVRLSFDLSLLGDLYPDRYRVGKEGIMAEFRLVYTE